LFVRPGELGHAEWNEVDLEKREWRIPAEKMKMKMPHLVPLSRQACEILRKLELLSGNSKYLFPGLRTRSRPISDITLNAALRNLGYSGDVHTAHGFRASARTMLDEILGERVDLIEHQLAHAVKDANGRAYNRTSHLDARHAMMQRWADYLHTLAFGGRPGPSVRKRVRILDQNPTASGSSTSSSRRVRVSTDTG
jgi:integrase